MHHWKDVTKGLAEAYRVLAPGGRVLAIERQVKHLDRLIRDLLTVSKLDVEEMEVASIERGAIRAAILIYRLTR